MPKINKAKPSQVEASAMPRKVAPVKAVNLVPETKSVTRPIFRLFECIVHLEQALAHVQKVGIIPATMEPTTIGDELNQVKIKIQSLKDQYNKAWIAEQSK